MVIGVMTIVFMLIHVVPGDPVEVMLGESARAADREALRETLGLNLPLSVQWINYVNGLLHLDLGTSLHTKRPVVNILSE
ncbi:MAG: glutathione ABC transporter permease GsiC, partial [Gammaproteobacteria bacterium]|nr:glutathione ABC transporter permease GsiC [Gammaproteobacteria bacterium]